MDAKETFKYYTLLADDYTEVRVFAKVLIIRKQKSLSFTATFQQILPKRSKPAAYLPRQVYNNNPNTKITTPSFHLALLRLEYNVYVPKVARYPINTCQRNFKYKSKVSGALSKI
jgi:hypothetical protein